MKPNREFLIQWHLTNLCDSNCKHCYMTPEERKKSENELSLDESKQVIDKLTDFAKLAGLIPRICFTGGNPLQKKNIEDILSHAKKRKIMSHILGNPTGLTKEIIEMLKKNNVSRYQLSFDGLKETHDELRGIGAYDKGIEAIKNLSKEGIQTVVMNTVNKRNQHELPTLARTVISYGAQRFDFARLVPIGNGAELKDLTFKPQEYRAFLNNMHEEYKKMIKEGIPEKFLGTKDPLWSLLLFEKGELELPPNDGLVYTGCSIGKNGFCMEPDGSIYACRRMPLKIGNIKESSIRKFFFNNKEMNEYRKVEKIEGCNDCELIQICRGCRAVAHAETGSYFGKDPQCWK